MNRDPTKPPLDYDDDYDPTGYYARKAKHREEMLPYLVAVFLGAVACGGVVFAWTVVS